MKIDLSLIIYYTHQPSSQALAVRSLVAPAFVCTDRLACSIVVQTTGGKSAAGADGIDAASDDEGAGAGDAGSEPERSDEDESGQSLVIRDRVHEKLTEAAQKEAGRLVKPIAHLVCALPPVPSPLVRD